jgi:hypothetical protein
MANSNYQKGQFLVVPNKAIVLKLRGAALNVYLAIVDHADDNGKCFPSHARLADVTGYTSRQCRTAIDQLVEKDLLKKKGRARNDGSQTSNIYQLIVIHTREEPDFHPTPEPDFHPGGAVDFLPKPNPSNSNQFNSKDLSFEKRKAWAKACEADRALARREVRRAAPSIRGSFGSIGEIVGARQL